uniref:THAP domain-containing protein 1 n=1 Tax=Cyprinus carpio carpio TaxID=630221 RepID=A0A9J8BMA1_CYPCA
MVYFLGSFPTDQLLAKSRTSAKFNTFLSFHTFPKDKEIQKRWVVNIRRDHFTVTNQTRVCSRHFQSTDLIEPQTPAGRRRLKNGTVPLLFHWNNFSLPAPRTGVWERVERPNTDTLHTEAPSMDVEYSDHDYCSSAEPAALDLSLDHNEDQIARLQKQIEEITISTKFCLERFAATCANCACQSLSPTTSPKGQNMLHTDRCIIL